MVTHEFAPATERCTAAMTSHFDNGENYEGAICVGVYPENDAEIWIEIPAKRMNLNVDDVNEFCRQLKRTAKIAREQQS